MLKNVIAHSIDIDTPDAIEEVLAQCSEQLGEHQPHAGILFVAIDHEHDLILKKINEKFPGIELVGCTTDGELSSVEGFADDSISLILLSSDDLDFKAGVADNVSKDPFNNIKEAVNKTRALLSSDPKLCIVTPTGLTVSGSVILEGLKQVLGDKFPIFGGIAGDQWKFKKTYQFCKNNVYSDSVPFIFISGPLLYSFGVESGWKPIGENAKVTKSENNVVFEIDNKPAIEFYRSYLGEGDLNLLGEYPLAVYIENENGFYLRACITCDPQKGIMTFVGDVPEGATIQFTSATRDNIINAAKKSVDKAVEDFPGNKPDAAVCFSCAGRKNVLGTRTKEEYEILKNHFPDLTFAGFYGYGEISPINRDKPTRFHNETFVSLLLGLE